MPAAIITVIVEIGESLLSNPSVKRTTKSCALGSLHACGVPAARYLKRWGGLGWRTLSLITSRLPPSRFKQALTSFSRPLVFLRRSAASTRAWQPTICCCALAIPCSLRLSLQILLSLRLCGLAGLPLTASALSRRLLCPPGSFALPTSMPPLPHRPNHLETLSQ